MSVDDDVFIHCHICENIKVICNNTLMTNPTKLILFARHCKLHAANIEVSTDVLLTSINNFTMRLPRTIMFSTIRESDLTMRIPIPSHSDSEYQFQPFYN